ncbi:MAG: hypothetical protein PHR90_07885 [Sphaerochaetaceae bacterium]|nr:hypothetical protein [Sphaerochaetaceae bacterium]
MRRILMVLAILVCSVSVVSAGLISFGFGVHASNPIPMDQVDGFGTIEDWRVGGEARLGLLFAEATASAAYDPASQMLVGMFTVGTSMSLFDLLHVGVGAGPAIAITMADGEVDWSYRNSNGAYIGATDLSDAVDNGVIHYRAHGDIKLGRVSLGMSVQVPSAGYTLAQNEVWKLTPSWEDSTLGASLLFWLF